MSPPESDRPDVDHLIAGLAGEGVVESEGTFTLDREKAREKTREFQLPDPRSYVLELVQAAVLKGATEIDFEIEAGGLRMEFDGAPFTVVDFDLLYNAMFTGEKTPEIQARRELALGLNSALSLDPRSVTVQSGDGKTGATLELRPGADDRFGPLDSPPSGTTIRVKSRLGMDRLRDVVQDLKGKLPEEKILRDRCKRASIPIRIGKKRISKGWFLSDAVGVVTLDEPEGYGLVGHKPDDRNPAKIIFVKDGVKLKTHTPELIPPAPGLVAVVDFKTLRKDMAQADIVRDDAYLEVCRRVRDAADTSFLEIVRSLSDPVEPESYDIGWIHTLVEASMHRLGSWEDLLDEDPNSLGHQIGRAPTWETATKKRVALGPLLSRGPGRLRCASAHDARQLPNPPSGSDDPLLYLEQFAGLTGLLGDRIERVVPQRPTPGRDEALKQFIERTAVVDAEGGGDFRTLSEALSVVPESSTILVRSGRYRERLAIDKTVGILGDGPRDDIVLELDDVADKGDTDHSVEVMGETVIITGVSLRMPRGARARFSFRKSRVVVEDCDISARKLRIASKGETTIRGCRIHHLEDGVALRGDGSFRVEDTHIHGSKQGGIEMSGSASFAFVYCTIHDFDDNGIGFTGKGPIEIRDCRIFNVSTGIELETKSGADIADCVVNGRYCGIRLYKLNSCTVNRCRVSGGGTAMDIKKTTAIIDHSMFRDHEVRLNRSTALFRICQFIENDGMEINKKSDCTLDDCVLSGGHMGYRGLLRVHGTVTATGCTIKNGGHSGVELDEETAVAALTDCEVTDCSANSGIQIKRGKVDIRNCRITRNEVGITIVSGASGIVADSDLTGNTKSAWRFKGMGSSSFSRINNTPNE